MTLILIFHLVLRPFQAIYYVDKIRPQDRLLGQEVGAGDGPDLGLARGAGLGDCQGHFSTQPPASTGNKEPFPVESQTIQNWHGNGLPGAWLFSGLAQQAESQQGSSRTVL